MNGEPKPDEITPRLLSQTMPVSQKTGTERIGSLGCFGSLGILGSLGSLGILVWIGIEYYSPENLEEISERIGRGE